MWVGIPLLSCACELDIYFVPIVCFWAGGVSKEFGDGFSHDREWAFWLWGGRCIDQVNVLLMDRRRLYW